MDNIHRVGHYPAWHAIITLEQHTLSIHHRPLTTYMISLCRAWHAIISLGMQTLSGNVGRFIPSSPFESKHDRTTSGVAYYHRPMTEHIIGPRRELHAHMFLGLQTRSKDVRRGMPLSPSCSTNVWTTSGMTCHHRPWGCVVQEI